MKVNKALKLRGTYGIKANTTKRRAIEVRVYLKDYYTSGGREDLEGFLYGAFTTSNLPYEYVANPWTVTYTNASCTWPVIGNFACFITGGPTYTMDSNVFKSKVLQGATHITDIGPDSSYLAEMEVVIELELTSDYSAINDVKEIGLPGIELLHPEDFVTSVKGINYYIRTAAANATLDAQDPTIPYTPDYVEPFYITKDLLPNDDNLNYQMAVPRIIKQDIFSGLPGTFKERNPASFTTNMVVYPSDDDGEGTYFNVITSLTDTSIIKLKMQPSAGLTFTHKGSIFDASVDNQTYSYHLYRVDVPDGIDRVIIEKIDNFGPFPASGFGLHTERPILADYNRRMLAKQDLPENDRIMVAWHRGFWRDYPENTLQSIEAAKAYLSTSDILELDVSRASDLNNSDVYNYVLYHDPFMFRESTIGPNHTLDQCVNPYDKFLVESTMLASAKRAELRNLLKERFPGYTETEYDEWILGPKDFTLAKLTAQTVRDRFGCLTNINIPTFDEALDAAKENGLSIVVDKGWDDIDNMYWHAVMKDYEDHVFFKGGDSRQADKLTKMYGDQLFRQIAYTPFYFDNKAQQSNAVDGDGNLIFLQAFLDKEANEKWI
ncbi:glycerophosphodiester phosphodiesterase family protein, partial [Flavicella sp.]